MKETLQNILIADENNDGLKIRNQKFSNEIICEKTIFRAIIDRVNLSNCQFKTVDLLSNSFLDCTFKNCEIIHSEAVKADFQETIFKNCEFKQVDFGWSYFANCQFLEIRLDDIHFEGTIISDLKAKNTTSLNLHFNEKFPMKFWKCNQPIEIKDFSSFEKLLKDNDSD